jgi:hypothetical protein
MEEVIKPQNGKEMDNEDKDKANVSFSKTDIIKERNQTVKNAMAQELLAQGLPEKVIMRILNFEER